MAFHTCIFVIILPFKGAVISNKVFVLVFVFVQHSLQMCIFQLVESCHQYNKHKTDVVFHFSSIKKLVNKSCVGKCLKCLTVATPLVIWSPHRHHTHARVIVYVWKTLLFSQTLHIRFSQKGFVSFLHSFLDKLYI